ncbi:MAG: epimerase [Acidobacteriales bacterium 59-55]|nr:NAD-dependent epimerase/dehydratase family protein [Terriglobales bacterium]OJV43907.1 MAG: epimerase [Acidobacteriales bacterium 59-55]
MKILITGGAGFIGTHLSRHLLSLGHQLTLLDNFLPQVHANAVLAPDIAPHVNLVIGDVTDESVMRWALNGVQCIVHLAAETGTGQSMYEVARYEHTNLFGTALIYDLLAKMPRHGIERIVVASSRSIYGEGAYRCLNDGLVYPNSRSAAEKQEGYYDPICPQCGKACEPAPTPEAAPLQPMSFYGLTKQVQEQTVLLFGNVLGIPSFALRYQNVYGPGQSLQNPYTGILAIFSNLARVAHPISVFEDGAESRDFVYVDDAVRATAACIVNNISGCHALNVGSGERTSVLQVAEEINLFYGGHSSVNITGAFREGDIRHGAADLARAQSLLGYIPQWTFKEGIRRFMEWAEGSTPSVNGYERSLLEMKQRGLLHERT